MNEEMVGALREHITRRQREILMVLKLVIEGADFNKGAALGRVIEYQGRLDELEEILGTIVLADQEEVNTHAA